MHNLVIILAISLSLFGSQAWSQSAEEAAAKAAEQAGRLPEALTHYTMVLQKTAYGSADEQRLCESAIRVAQKLSPAPNIPEEARRFSIRAQAWLKDAKSVADFGEAVKEFSKALRVAPWWGDMYYNRGVVLEKAGRYAEAIGSYKLYLLASPSAPDAGNVKDQIYALEVKQEKAQRDSVAVAQEQQRRRQEEEARAANPARLAGDWCVLHPSGQVWCEGHLRQIRISGNAFEIWERGRIEFRGTVRGDELTGSYSPSVLLLGHLANCTDQPLPMQGRVSRDGNQIDLSYTNVANIERNCTISATRPDRLVLVRRR